MRLKRTKDVLARSPEAVEISATDRAALTGAFEAGLIVAWKRDDERRYRLTRAGRPDEYVEVTKLIGYLERLKGAA